MSQPGNSLLGQGQQHSTGGLPDIESVEYLDAVQAKAEAIRRYRYEALKQGECVSLRNFGTFYVRSEQESWVFKFSPSQRLRKLFGWSSTYKGKL